MFKVSSFRFKIFIIVFTAILVPMISVSLIIQKKSEVSITDQTSKMVLSGLDDVISDVDICMQSVLTMSNSLKEDIQLRLIAEEGKKFNDDDKISHYMGIRQKLDFLMTRSKQSFTLPGIDSFYVYLQNQSAVIDSKTTYYEEITEENVDFLNKLKDKNYKGGWFIAKPINYTTLNAKEDSLFNRKVLSYCEYIFDENNKTDAISINFRDDFINDHYNNIRTGIDGNFIVVDENSIVISSREESQLGQSDEQISEINNRIKENKTDSGSFFYIQNNESKYIVYTISPYTKWRYIVEIPSHSILGKIYEIQNFIMIIILVTIILVFLITIALSDFFYKPLEKLVSAMQQIESRNLKIRIYDKRTDEYSKVYNGFNNMVVELKSLINDLTNEKILKKEAEIKLLQAQINPHFLYNTLESIHSMAKLNRVAEISQMVSALSSFFRTSLSSGKDIVLLEEAVKLAVNYLIIQNIRFKDKISYGINVPQNLLSCRVPKLILQPVVENSIYHGIEKKKGTGTVWISAQIIDDCLQLLVEDDGEGISEKVLKDIQQSIDNDSFEDSKNFALKNINRQIKLKYGNGYGLVIQSISGTGTRVIITLPVVY